MLKDRIAIEIYYAVERVIQETDQWYAKAANELPNFQDQWHLQDSLQYSGQILRDLLVNLYKKFEHIIERSMFVEMVIQKLSKVYTSNMRFTRLINQFLGRY